MPGNFGNESVSKFQIAGFGFTDSRSEAHKLFLTKDSNIISMFNSRNSGDVGIPSDWLLKAVVEAIPPEECNGNYTKSFKNVAPSALPKWIDGTQLCAKNRMSRSNTCQGKLCLIEVLT